MNNPPKRRDTRQRSGYTVTGEKSGNEAKIIQTSAYQIPSTTLVLSFESANAELTSLFESGIGMAAIGGYLKPETPLELTCSVKALNPLDDSTLVEAETTYQFPANIWSKFGLHIILDDASLYPAVSLKGGIRLSAATPLGTTQFWGVNLNTVTEYATESVVTNFGTDAFRKFNEKTHLYYPEIYYWQNEQTFAFDPLEYENLEDHFVEGEQLVLKACNRCNRFLPIDVEDERHELGFSNHCVKRAPCTHSGFSRFIIENWAELNDVDLAIQRKIVAERRNHFINPYYGFQLECRPCKKFKVNAPLNPLRNTAQHREDSLRRRAQEDLVRELLGADWIFYKFRREGRKEFDTHIWEKFGQQCFACGKPLPLMVGMHLDHTLPLVYLWPLDETATCLCATCNSQKHDKFPFEFQRYKEPEKLQVLARITGISEELLLDQRKQVNPVALKALRARIEWFFDEFLATADYQKVRAGKKAADLIVHSLQKVLNEVGADLNLIEEYTARTARAPTTVTIRK